MVCSVIDIIKWNVCDESVDPLENIENTYSHKWLMRMLNNVKASFRTSARFNFQFQQPVCGRAQQQKKKKKKTDLSLL